MDGRVPIGGRVLCGTARSRTSTRGAADGAGVARGTAGRASIGLRSHRLRRGARGTARSGEFAKDYGRQQRFVFW